MDVDDPETLAELEAMFAAYERALVGNDVAALDGFFIDLREGIRYGAAENLHGIEEIRAFRAARPSAGLARTLERTQITTYGRDLGIAATLFAARTLPARSAGRCRHGCGFRRAGASSRRISA